MNMIPVLAANFQFTSGWLPLALVHQGLRVVQATRGVGGDALGGQDGVLAPLFKDDDFSQTF